MKIKPIGIDLGTTYSAASTINEAGKPEIIANSEGERITASAIYFEDKNTFIVGNTAIEKLVEEPDKVAMWFKRGMGDKDYSFVVNDKKLTSVELSSLVLKKIYKDVLQVYPNNVVNKVVVTVPAYFDEFRRKATMDAAKLAGLEVLKIINEPTAAALAYASQGNHKGKCLIYDFGGGTFDVSIVDIKNANEVEVIASEGDHKLGGHDIDVAIGNYFASQFGEGLMSIKDKKVRNHNIKASERAKKNLSNVQKVTVRLMNKNGGADISSDLTREKFEEIISKYITRTEMLVESAISQAVLSDSDIEHILLVGGSSRIPAVTTMLRKKFGKNPKISINPDEAVSLGAAIQAGILISDNAEADLSSVAKHSLKKTIISDVATNSFGTLFIESISNTERNKILIPKNTPLPASKTETFLTIRENQDYIRCTITQGDDEDPAMVKTIEEGKFELPSNRPAGCPIQVTYIYDVNGRVSCNFLDVWSGKSKVFSLDSNQANKATYQFSESDFDDMDIK